MSIWDNQGFLEHKEEQRARRRSDRLTFDCFHLKYEGSRAYCDRGKRFGQTGDGSMSLIAVLGGITSKICKNCEDFTTEEE